MIRRRSLVAALTVLLLASSCAGGDDSEGTTPSTITAPPGEQTSSDDPCDGVELEETDVGVTEDKIVVQVMADTGADDVGDRSRDAVEAVEAWADAVNERGGLACREVEVRTWDSRLSAAATAEGVVDACARAVAMVGTSALLMLDATVLTTCPDSGFAALGIPDLAERAVEVPHQCATQTFSVVGTSASCPYTGGVRGFTEMVGPFRFLQSLASDGRGAFLVRGETPESTRASISQVRAAQAAGLVASEGEVAGTRHERSEAAATAFELVDQNRVRFVHNDAHPDVLSELQKQAAEGDTSPVNLWMCSAECYTKSFRERDESEGTYVWLPHLPFEEADTIASLRAYVEAVGGIDDASTTGLAAWTAATTFEQVVEQIVRQDGYNAVTRARILDLLVAQRDSPGTGASVFGPDFRLDRTPECFVMLRVVDGEFERVHPTAPGTLDCEPENMVTVELDPDALRPA